MKRTVGRLADGRQIFWYTAGARALPAVRDPRSLPSPATTTEIRYDRLADEWVGMSAQRQDRIYHPPADQCPLCPTRDGRHSEIPSVDYEVVVFENRFPSFAEDIVGPVAGDAADRRPGHGRCEVVCFTSDHNSTFAELSPERVRLVVDVWADRTEALSRLNHVEQVYPFENRGIEIGVTLAHPHGQIYAYPFVTPRTRRHLASGRRHRSRTGGNLFRDVLSREGSYTERVIAESQHWTAFVPHAARWPVEVHLYPHRRMPDIPALTDAERDDFAVVYLDVLRRMDGLYDARLPYIAGWHQAPVRVDRDLAYLHLEVFSVRRSADKLKYLAGSESGMDVFVNDVLPEEVAARLRSVDVGRVPATATHGGASGQEHSPAMPSFP